MTLVPPPNDTPQMAYEFWICHECLLTSGSPDTTHEHGALARGHWIPAEPRAGEISVAEFREQGYLQEVNRRLLHPLGLALVATTLAGWECIVGVRDDRADPEGIAYAPGAIPPELKARAYRIDTEWRNRAGSRMTRLGYVTQPIEDC